MASKQVRKLESTTQNEVLEIEMAIRDEDGKRIKANYATKGELQTAQTTLSGEIDANTAAISGLTTRVGSAEGTISGHTTSISSLGTRVGSAETSITSHGTRLGTLETFKTNTESALTTINSDIDSLEDSLDEIERVANGAHNTFVVETTKSTETISTPFGYANDYISNHPDDAEVVLNFADAITMGVFTDVTVPEALLSSATLQSHPDCVLPAVVFIPTGLTAQEKAQITSKIPSKYSALNPQLIEVRIGDNILFKQQDIPDRWISGIDKSKGEYTLSTLEAQKMNMGGFHNRLTACENTNNAQGTAISGLQTDVSNLQTTVAGKMDNKTIDSEPTSGNTTHLISSAAVYTALQSMQSSLGISSTILGNVTIND